ncbi:class I SAM-dependent methyltransferase [Nocardioides panaciterrulae]|uniref:Ubiquinone/menaquinone biosynthesis C-methylase UbiE n=1 Tax=Nocardioides panaciterrulae TaxID=661492 RepID=A0A7Y9JC43_9ACTN|nr:class I SAM-dependent methyltransferase [Nocardioides panaciterrulae]NYD43615.1 ubiquinone/menaquinone biosynthesis C-methylase UbiE [Nocardioides panaciterrulae]
MNDAPQHPPTGGPTDPARSFGSVVEAYHRGRPSYPREAAAWLAGEDPATVLELGAGTGKLTAQLVALGHDVHATDPDEAMLAVLRRDLPDVRTSVAAAEELPLPDASVDVVVCAQAFHWFDLDRALPEIARVLKQGGRLAVVWNQRDERIPWVRRLGGLIGTQDQLREPAEPLVRSALFGFVEDATYRFWQTVDRQSIQQLVLSRSNVAVLDEEARAAKLAEVVAFYDDFGRGMDGMQLPYEARCFRTKVLDQKRPAAAPDHPEEPGEPDTSPDSGPGPARRAAPVDGPASEAPEAVEESVSDGTDTDMLLIDFR